MSTDGKGETTIAKPNKSGRNRLLLSLAIGLAFYLVGITVQGLLAAPGWLAGWHGEWFIAPLVIAFGASRMALGWLRCRAASKKLTKEREVLISHVREMSYNINNPLNAIVAHIVALKTEYNPGSVEQIEVSSQRIARMVNKLATLDLAKLQAEIAAQAASGKGVNVEEMGRAGSL